MSFFLLLKDFYEVSFSYNYVFLFYCSFLIITHKKYTEPNRVGWNFLITIGKATHSAHHAEDIVVGSEDIHLGTRDRADRVVRHREEERGVINAG